MSNNYGSLRLPSDVYLIDGRPTVKIYVKYFSGSTRRLYLATYFQRSLPIPSRRVFMCGTIYEQSVDLHLSRRELAPLIRGLIDLLELSHGTRCRILNKHLLRNH